ncbi:hypothetical protein CONLIGDRAFT_688280 [Coniochaeta ligniaria NRRL 30616]|uniref:2EXR domain-containing protein n=1 Tax=Coniochaeta ligniaria NRRL 30616 TaxID=1408157 RepID=A0A1J7J2V9_9PEZI|nr:hypothetical protein CONLIGDRAFT_688280 [Coniochaeta ligniaria NRRL 30616]
MHYDHQHQAHIQVMNMSEKFNYFQKLPAEIRTMIWEYSLPESRVYEVLDAPNATQKTPAQQGLMFANVHPEPPPALAAVCRESRYFVLHHYKPLTLGKTTKYVDPSRDILLLEPYLLVKRLHRTLHFMSQIPLMRDNINRLALGTSYGIYTGICHPVLNWKVSKTNVGKLLSSLAKFPKLKTLIFIVHQEFQFEFDFRFPHAGGGSFGTLTHDLPMSHAPLHSASMNAVTPFQPPFINNLRTPAIPTLAPLPPPTPRTPAHMQQQRLPPQLPQPPLSHHLPPPSPPHPPPSAPTTTTTSYPPQQRPQLVHQAYRFKFDIEANINHTPRRPHLNELLYYPLDYDEDKDDLNDADEGEESDEWCDPWPTNDDWRRFRRRLVKAIRLTLQGLGNNNNTEGGDDGCGRGGGGGGGGGYKVAGGGPWGSGRAEEDGGRSESSGKAKMCVPALKGASLLWRYTKGGYV